MGHKSRLQFWRREREPADLRRSDQHRPDRGGNLLVVDSGTNSTVKVSPTGAELPEWGEWGASPGEFELRLGSA